MSGKLFCGQLRFIQLGILKENIYIYPDYT